MIEIARFAPAHASGVASLIVPIQREEFGIPITLAEQPDLADIRGFYQRGAGNFWVALDAGEVGFDVYPAGAPAQVAERTVKLGEMPRDGGALVELVFRLPKAARGVELRTYSRGGARIALEAVELSR